MIGCKRLKKCLETLLVSQHTRHQNGSMSVLLPPHCIVDLNADPDEDTFLNDGMYCWVNQAEVLSQDFLNTIDRCFVESNFTTLSNDENDVLADTLHQLCDELPIPGSCTTQLYLFFDEQEDCLLPYSILGPMKRLEVWHQCFFGIISDSLEEKESLVCFEWMKFINFNILSMEDLIPQILYGNYFWYGSLNVIFEKASGNHLLNQYGLYLPEGMLLEDVAKDIPLFKHVIKKDDTELILDNQIQIVSTIQQEDIPFQLVCPLKFKLMEVSPKQKQSESFFDHVGDSSRTWYLAFLKYNISLKKPSTYQTTAWNNFIQDEFTQYLTFPESRSDLKHHISVILRRCPSKSHLDMYIIQSREAIDSVAFLDLLKKEDFSNNNLDCKDGDDMKFDFLPVTSDDEWCEKTCWYNEENASKVGKSISRCKSNDFYMKGVELPVSDTAAKTGIQESLSDVLCLFDKNGCAMTQQNFQAIPIIADRLLKNMSREEDVRSLSYEDAEKVIGHGIEYCVDSHCSLRLDNRLIKVQKRYVPEDTINMTSFHPKQSQSDDFGAKENSKMRKRTSKRLGKKSGDCSKVQKKTQAVDMASNNTETRAQRHFRRLQTLIEGTVVKYGGMLPSNVNYKKACQRLFDICVPIVKCLTTSKDLNQQMKKIAKDHVETVMKSFKS